MNKKAAKQELLSVSACDPELAYSGLDHNLQLTTDVLDSDGNYAGESNRCTLFSVLESFFLNTELSPEALDAAEKCFLFGLLEIAKYRAKSGATR